MSDNWIVANLENAFNTWNDKMAEIWSLITTSPQSFRGGAVYIGEIIFNMLVLVGLIKGSDRIIKEMLGT